MTIGYKIQIIPQSLSFSNTMASINNGENSMVLTNTSHNNRNSWVSGTITSTFNLESFHNIHKPLEKPTSSTISKHGKPRNFTTKIVF
ncbi:hypothetical protein C1H46_013745 [Malus baccata]|uniref:Uncharacterized protein n=1 Tax=Malus baccata TaxID=106549 RepID=A0A540MP95_MALBA|nr:hypothetical protein C1H46_013745 [Malus baccata]